MADHFDEKSGIVPSKTPWGSWSQTIDEVYIEVNVPKGTRGREVVCEIKPKRIRCTLKGRDLFKGELFGTVLAEESTWTLEDNELVHIVLIKSDRDAANCWKSLLADQYQADVWTFSEMEKKMTLQRFQKEASTSAMQKSQAAILEVDQGFLKVDTKLQERNPSEYQAIRHHEMVTYQAVSEQSCQNLSSDEWSHLERDEKRIQEVTDEWTFAQEGNSWTSLPCPPKTDPTIGIFRNKT